MDTAEYNIFDAIMAIECEELTQEEYVTHFQTLIDSGIVWQLQGTYGRVATSLIEGGLCHA
jgi:hypothetical protein